MVAFAAYTGARRSEILRVKLSDLDLAAKVVTIHEKKRQKGRRTTRRVPLSTRLVEVLKGWLAVHPGGPFLFCHAGEVARSKKRSGTTGHQNEKVRRSSQRGRMATVRRRKLPVPGALTKDEAHDHLKRTLAGGKWAVVRGWHVFRHALCSNMAAKGVDQRFIDEVVGHQTEDMRRRYRHLTPSVIAEAIDRVFG